MPTRKKGSTTAGKKRGAKRATAKKTARVRSARKKAVAKKTAARKKPAASTKVVAPRKTAARRKSGVTARARRAAPASDFINPQLQLTKLGAETSAPSSARTASRGSSMLAATAAPAGATMPEDFFSAYTGAPLTEQDFADAAQTLGCEVAAVKAVAEVESAGAGFDRTNRPTILYERHIFARHTVPADKFDQTHPDLSGRKPYPPGTYGSKDLQFVKLARAFQLDREAALKAPSWGKFQILGENYKACGFTSVADYVKAMTIAESEHLKAFVRFLLTSPKRLEAIRDKNWAAFALHYNGPQYAKFKYDTKLAAAYAKHARSA